MYVLVGMLLIRLNVKFGSLYLHTLENKDIKYTCIIWRIADFFIVSLRKC